MVWEEWGGRFPFPLFLAVLVNPPHKPHVNSYLLRLWQARLGFFTDGRFPRCRNGPIMAEEVDPGAGDMVSSWHAPHLEAVTAGLWLNSHTKRSLVFASCELLHNPPSTAARTWLCALRKVAIWHVRLLPRSRNNVALTDFTGNTAIGCFHDCSGRKKHHQTQAFRERSRWVCSVIR